MYYFYNGILSFDPSLYAGLGDLHIKILALHVGGNRRRDVDIVDLLGPFVR